MSLLQVNNLRISFKTNGGILKAVRGVSFSLDKQEVVALVGESGSGKSVTCKAIMQLLDNNAYLEEGEILFHNKNVLRLKEKDLNALRGSQIACVYQDSQSTLNPLMQVGKQVEEAIKKKETKTRKKAKEYLLQYKRVLKYLSNNEKDYVYKLNEKKEINRLIDLVKEFDFNDVETFSYEKTCLTIKKINKQIKKLVKNPLYNFNELLLYQNQFNNFILNYKKAIEEENEQNKLFAKYNVYSYYDLPLNERAQNKEKIILPIDVYHKMKKEVIDCLSYLEKGIEVFNFSYEEEKRNLDLLNKKMTKSEIHQKVVSIFKEVGITSPEERYYLHPFELSGGLRQRVMISIALASDPEILICDEPTTALDATIQKQIIDLLKKLKRERNLSIIFISHDLGVVANIADKVFIMYVGKIVEKGTVYDIFYDPRHPYTWALLGSVPTLQTEGELSYIKGNVPNMLIPARGDNFAQRNIYSLKQDYLSFPKMVKISSSHSVASFLCYEEANEVNKPLQIKNRLKHYVEFDGRNMPLYDNKKNSILEEVKNELQ